MRPVLFSSDATTFTTNGLGRLDAISCVVIEERNGLYELEMEIAETANHARNIEMNSIIVVKVPDKTNLQAFRVYKITKPLNGKFKVLAQHISYQLSYIPCMPFSIMASSSACNDTLQALKTNAVESCPFNFSTDITTVASYVQTAPASIRSRLGGVNGSVLDQFGGEFEWDNYNISLKNHRGVTTPTVTLNYGKNITDINQEEKISETITGIVPFWQSSDGNTTVTLPERVVDSQYASAYPFKRTVPYNFSQDFQSQPTENELRAKAQAYVNASGVGIPKVSIKLSFISLSDTENYKDIAPLQDVNLCDNIKIYFEKLGIATTAEIVKTRYDVLGERYNSIEIGSLRGTLATTISGTASGITELANNTQRMFQSYSNNIGELVDNATAWLTDGGGYVVANRDSNGEWKELFFMDTNDINTAVNVLRINQNGIGFSSTGVGGPYTQAWTLDGRLVVGGTNVPSISVYDNDNNLIFQASSSGLFLSSKYQTSTSSSYDYFSRIMINEGSIAFKLIERSKSNPSSETEYNIGKIASSATTGNFGKHLEIGSDNYTVRLTSGEDVFIDAPDVILQSSGVGNGIELTGSSGAGVSLYSDSGDIDITAAGGAINISTHALAGGLYINGNRTLTRTININGTTLKFYNGLLYGIS